MARLGFVGLRLLSLLGIATLAAWGCTPAPAPEPMPRAPKDTIVIEDPPEIASEGNSSVTVIERPDHPLVRPQSAPAPKVMTDTDCRATEGCATSGACSASGTTCVANDYLDCEQMRDCGGGRCDFVAEGEAGRCVVVADCKLSHDCRTRGLCGERDGLCRAQTSDGCRQSERCRSEGLCTLDDGLCVAKTMQDCASSPLCLEQGRCEPVSGLCRATSDRMCLQSPVCRTDKRCRARNGVCLAACEGSDLCKRLGQCRETKRDGALRCVAMLDASCEASEICTTLGLCTAGVGGECEAGDDVECLRSSACKEDGRCRARQGRCMPTSDAECKQSRVACGREGRCRHEGGRCVR
ncbi:MAG: hypothetical protein KC731_12460 [Myxococcales bacterium]|nr:hypothetical protein [Myxococcales bacterium]